MTAVQELLDRLAPVYRIVETGKDMYAITHVDGRTLASPTRLELNTDIFEQYVADLVRRSGEPTTSSAVGLVEVHVDAAMESAAAMGRAVTALGVRRRRFRRPSWFVDRPPLPKVTVRRDPELRWGP